MASIRILYVMLFSMILSACGGGGSLETPDGTSSDSYKLEVELQGTDGGQGTLEVSKAVPGKLVATLTKNNQVFANQLITFTLGDQGVGVLDPEVGTAQTNSSGQAEILLKAGTVPGSGTVTATFTSTDDRKIEVPFVFTSKGDDDDDVVVEAINLTLAISNTTVSAATPATITALVTKGINLEPVANKVVTFSSSLGDLAPASKTALTNSNGIATITLTAGNVAGAGEVTASIASGENSIIGFNTLGDIDAYILSVVLQSANTGSVITEISKADPGKLITTLMKNNQPVSNQLVTFSLGTPDVGILDPEVGTAQTNDAGQAEISLRAGTNAGAGTVLVSYTTPEEQVVTATGTYTSKGDDDDITGGFEIALSISDTTVSANNPVTVTAVVTRDGAVAVNKVVTFESPLGAFSPTTGTALTDTNGIATITLTAGSVRGASEITASVSSGESSVIGFVTQGDDIGVVGDISITLEIVDLDGNEIDSITNSKPGRIIASVDGISNPVIVTFVSTVGEIPIATAITDENNQATVDIAAGDTLGAGTITASLSTGESGNALIVVGSSTVVMGSGEPFVEGVAEISLSQISAGGTTVVTVNIVDDQGNLFTEPVEINFSSGCASQSTPTAELSTPIVTSNGIANSTYLAKGCVGDDPISVNANAGGINLIATGKVNVLPADVGSIEFLSAQPEFIGIIGTGAVGGSESSTVKFRVLDTNGNPVNNQDVNFVLGTTQGNVTVTPSSATTNSEGIVQTVINSGTVSTSVRVTASIVGSDPEISTQSSVLVISTGIPDQDSFSLSASVFNPEAWSLDGTEVVITARMADAFNNPVPDGTAVFFTTEGGSIDDSCVTDNGSCFVTWRSQNARPEGEELTSNFCTLKVVVPGDQVDNNNDIECAETTNTLGQKYGGRATIVATAIGEESFPDSNGNGRFDAAEMTAFLGNDVSGMPFDLKEAFVDHNEDGFYNPEEAGGDPTDTSGSGDLEEPIDFNNDGSFTLNDGMYNGVLCSIPAHDGCSQTQKSLNVRGSLVLVMSGSSPYIQLNETIDAVLPTIEVDDDGDPETPPVNEPNPDFDYEDKTINIAGENTGFGSIILSDLHNQNMPSGTIVEFSSTVGSVVVGASQKVPNSANNGGTRFEFGIKGEKDAKSGAVFVKITTPSGASVLIGIANINIR